MNPDDYILQQPQRGPTEADLEEDYYDEDFLDFASLDTCVSDDHWHQSYIATGSISISSDWD